MTARGKSSYQATVYRRNGAWLAGLAAVGLIGLAVFTAIVRADLVGEGYALARCEAQLRSVERRVRAVNADILERFAGFNQVVGAAASDAESSIEY